MSDYHRREIARNQDDIKAMKAGSYLSYDTDHDGRLSVETTERMITVAQNSIWWHGRCLLAELQNHAG